jgi:hypothetical protein
MENKIPLPTDNIYKFYALFGLFLFIFSSGSVIYVAQSTNELLFALEIEYETLPEIENSNASEIAKRARVDKQVEIALGNKKFLLSSLGVLFSFAAGAMFFGFKKWHQDIQPIQDETARLQLEKLRLEVAILSKQPAGPE